MLIQKISIRETGIRLEFNDGTVLHLPADDDRVIHLRQGDELSPERYHDLCEQSQDYQAYRSALSLLARRDRSVRETIQHLERKGFRHQSVDYTITRLLGKGYLDDQRYGLKLAESLSGKKIAGPDFIKRKLMQKGITGEDLKSVMATADTGQPYEKILALAKRKLHSLEGKKNPREKIIYFLRARGFNSEIIRRVLRDLNEKDEYSSEDES